MREQMTSRDEADHESASPGGALTRSDRSQAGESNPNDLIGTLTSPGRRAACDLQTRQCIGCARPPPALPPLDAGTCSAEPTYPPPNNPPLITAAFSYTVPDPTAP
jgi:hypothetical protein